jgi:hypothetical protein
LITGFNAAQVKRDYFLGQEVQVVPSHYSLIRCLEDMGYEVEQRPVTIGEDLSGYDEVVVYIHSIQSYCQRLWGGLYTIAARPDCIIAFDDWQVNQIYKSIDTYRVDLVDKNDDVAFRQYLFDLYQGKETPEEVKRHRSEYVEACDVVLAKRNRLLVSAFDRGDLSRLELSWPVERTFRFNPNPYHLNRRADNGYGTGAVDIFGALTEPTPKVREWNFASLVQEKTRKWLNSQNPDGWTWPVRIYGGRRGKFKSERLTEPDMCRKFSEQWGILMPGYFHTMGNTASGWWRARPLQVADAGSILVGEASELFVYYQDEYLSGLRAVDVESMDDSQLKETATAQREALYAAHPLDKAVERREMDAILQASR